MDRLLNKVFVIADSNNNISKTTASIAAKEGAIIVFTGKHLNNILPVVSEIKKNGGRCSAFQHEIDSLTSWQQVIAKITKKYGKIDVLVNAAGISSPKMLLELSLADRTKIQAVEINSFLYGLEAILPVMKQNGGGSIINISSIEGLINIGSNTSYETAKETLHSILTEASVNNSEDHIRINSICPGTVETALTETNFPKINLQYKQNVHFPYLGKPEDIANGIIYLACDEASFVTGAKLVINADRITL